MTPEDMVSGVSELVSLPEVCVRINEMLDDPGTTSKALGEVISHDPNLTARLLRMVNSAYYGIAAEVTTVSHAVTLVGLDELRSMVLATSASRAFANIPTELVDMDMFWHHSVYCGLVARVLGEVRGMRQRERLFVIGLLHDVGRLVLYHQAPAVARERGGVNPERWRGNSWALPMPRSAPPCCVRGVCPAAFGNRSSATTIRCVPKSSVPKRCWCTWPMRSR